MEIARSGSICLGIKVPSIPVGVPQRMGPSSMRIERTGKKGTGTKFRKGGENSSQSPFSALVFFYGECHQRKPNSE
jgi:hypothetical protein